jgi:hypothetical protein
MDESFRWVPKVNSFYWAFNALYVNEFKNNPEAMFPLLEYEFVADSFTWTASIGTAWGYIILICVVTRILTYLAMKYWSSTKI